jgi:hypothetical protein
VPPYNITLRVNDDSEIMAGPNAVKEVAGIDGTHEYNVTLTGVAAGQAGGANGNATASINVKIKVSHKILENQPIPEVTIAIE